ncbi:hypothetical protein OKHIF_26210 [Mycobacteroides chelonae]
MHALIRCGHDAVCGRDGSGSEPGDPAARPIERRDLVVGAQRAQLIGATQNLFGRVHDCAPEPVPAPVAIYRNAFHVSGAYGPPLMEQPALDHRGVGDECAVVPDERMHAAQAMFPVFLGELALKGFDQ